MCLIVYVFILGSVVPKQMDLNKRLAFPSRALWLRLFKEPSVWYSFSILIPPYVSCTLLSVQPCFLLLLSKGHGVCSHVCDRHFIRFAVVAPNILQRILSTFQGISFLKIKKMLPCPLTYLLTASSPLNSPRTWFVRLLSLCVSAGMGV